MLGVKLFIEPFHGAAQAGLFRRNVLVLVSENACVHLKGLLRERERERERDNLELPLTFNFVCFTYRKEMTGVCVFVFVAFWEHKVYDS